jgi:hypothetical protein
VIVGLVWLEFRLIGQHPAAEAQPGQSPAGQATIGSTSGAGAVPSAPANLPDLVDGDHLGMLLGSSKGKITVVLVNGLQGDAGLAKCRKDLGPQVSASAVCGVYYFPKIEFFVRTLAVDRKASIGYIANDTAAGALYSELSSANVSRLSALSQQYQQGKLFYLETVAGAVVFARQEALSCKDIDGITPDGKAEWTGKCVKRYRLG